VTEQLKTKMQTLDEFFADIEPHEREAKSLAEQIKDNGGTPPKAPTLKMAWPEGAEAYATSLKAHVETLRAMAADSKAPTAKTAIAPAQTSKPKTATEALLKARGAKSLHEPDRRAGKARRMTGLAN
jgi:hypothetical protein